MHTYGHRNVQGLAQRADGSLWSIEHGSDRDDEVNLLVNGGDYGWNPVPGYNESVPMTDQSPARQPDRGEVELRRPDRRHLGRRRSSTAASGARYDGALAVACLKASRVLFLTFDANGNLRAQAGPGRAAEVRPAARRSPRRPNGDLLVTTSNGGGNDVDPAGHARG